MYDTGTQNKVRYLFFFVGVGLFLVFDCVNSPVERIALSGNHCSENLGLLNLQMLETDLHQSHLLTPHLQNKERHQGLNEIPLMVC